MIVDTSALLAVLLREPDRPGILVAMAHADQRLMSSASYLEAGLKLIHVDTNPVARLDRALTHLDVTVVAVTPEQAREAVRARVRYGRAPARLNFGDCLVYALAKESGEPLLFKGEDFAHTDVARVTLPGA